MKFFPQLILIYFGAVYVAPVVLLNLFSALGFSNDYSIPFDNEIEYFFVIACFLCLILLSSPIFRAFTKFYSKYNHIYSVFLPKHLRLICFIFTAVTIIFIILLVAFLLSNREVFTLAREQNFSNLPLLVQIAYLFSPVAPIFTLLNVPIVHCLSARANLIYAVLNIFLVIMLLYAFLQGSFGVRPIALCFLSCLVQMKILGRQLLLLHLIKRIKIDKTFSVMISRVLSILCIFSILTVVSAQGFTNKNSTFFENQDRITFLSMLNERQATHAISALSVIDDTLSDSTSGNVPNALLISLRQFQSRSALILGFSSGSYSPSFSRINYEKIFSSYHPTAGASEGFVSFCLRSAWLFPLPFLYTLYSSYLAWFLSTSFMRALNSMDLNLSFLELYLCFALIFVQLTESVYEIFAVWSPSFVSLVLYFLLSIYVAASLGSLPEATIFARDIPTVPNK